MLNFTTDQWVIIGLIFVLGLLCGGFLFSGGGRKWKTRYNSEAERRAEIEKAHAAAERDWREQDSLRAAALKDRERVAPVVTSPADLNRDGVVDDQDRIDVDRAESDRREADRREADRREADRRQAERRDTNNDGVIDSRDV